MPLFQMRVSKEKDPDISEALEESGDKTEFVKTAIRNEIGRKTQVDGILVELKAIRSILESFQKIGKREVRRGQPPNSPTDSK